MRMYFFSKKCDIKCIGRGINMKKYMLRLFDDVLEKIKIYGPVLTIGPKWCGKSTIAK